jgi:hypothetical protein
MLDFPGVYLICCRPTGEMYVGATTTSFRQRFTEHRTQLGRGVCTIPLLQQRATEHGVEALEFIPLKAFPIEEIAAREKEALDLLKPALNIVHVRSKGSYQRWPKIDIDGTLYTVGEAARTFGILPRTLRMRIERGLTGQALIAPAHAAPRKTYVRRR